MNSKESLLETLAQSKIYQEYERAFGDATGLPLTLRTPDAWQVAQKLSTNELEREGIHLHFARWQINTGRYQDARRNLEAITNSFWLRSKETLVKKLAGREAGTNQVLKTTAP